MYFPMRLSVVSSILFSLVAPMPVSAETFHWVDDQGTMHFSDNPPANLPRTKRTKVQVRNDISINNPDGRESIKESQRHVNEAAIADHEKTRQRWLREAAEEQERKAYQARDKRLKDEQVKREQSEAKELKRRLDTTPVQRSAEELGGFSVSSGST